MPPAAQPATSDSAAGPPPSATTCQTTATAQSPAASSESAIDATSRRYWLCRRGANALGRLVMAFMVRDGYDRTHPISRSAHRPGAGVGAPH